MLPHFCPISGKYVAIDAAIRISHILDLEDVIVVPSLDPLLDPILMLIPLQLLAYYVARAAGRNIDRPRNLAKSVTVE